jgi:hypothetical protein
MCCSVLILLRYVGGTDAVFRTNPFGRNRIPVCAKEINFCPVNINSMEIKAYIILTAKRSTSA